MIISPQSIFLREGKPFEYSFPYLNSKFHLRSPPENVIKKKKKLQNSSSITSTNLIRYKIRFQQKKLIKIYAEELFQPNITDMIYVVTFIRWEGKSLKIKIRKYFQVLFFFFINSIDCRSFKDTIMSSP